MEARLRMMAGGMGLGEAKKTEEESEAKDATITIDSEQKLKEDEQKDQIDEKIEANNKRLAELLEAEPIADKLPYQGGSDSPAWRRKKVRKLGIKIVPTPKDPEETKSSDGEQNENDLAAAARNKKNQEKLQKMGCKIPVATQRNVRFDINRSSDNKAFKYLVYDGYRPTNLAQTREYIDFLLKDNVHKISAVDDEETPSHIVEYLQQDIKTALPRNIREDEVLAFDQNFEGGNLDSVFLKTDYEYDLIMKVDTNTRGNTYWFYFKVSEFQVGLTYKFNIVNFTRELDKFYKHGMNVCTRIESRDPLSSNREEENLNERKSAWLYDQCANVQFVPQGETIRWQRKYQPDVDKSGDNQFAAAAYSRRYFSRLSFSYKFGDETRGKTVAFAYAVPYGYTDLQNDLADVRTTLMASEGAQIKVGGREETTDLPSALPPQAAAEMSDDGNSSPNPQGSQGGQGAQDAPSKKPLEAQKRPAEPANLTTRVVAQAGTPGLAGSSVAKPTVHDMQQHQIKREGQAQIVSFGNHFENRVRDQQMDMTGLIPSNAKLENGDKLTNFEITTNYLHYRQEVIGQSVCGLDIYVVTITKRAELSVRYKKKSVVYIQSRLHAAETHGSLIMQHIMLDLARNPQAYDKLLSGHIIKLVPMLNPDGVVIGNSRSSVAGLDLNRRWSDPSPVMHPEIYFIKYQMKKTETQCKQISVFCDLHGHNKRLNAFIYGCNKAPNEGLLSWTKTRLLPKILASYEPIFNYNHCLFSQEKLKYNTARVVVWNEFRVMNSFTLECSMYGAKVSEAINVKHGKIDAKKLRQRTKQLDNEDFKSIALSLLKTFLQYAQLEVELEKEFKMTGGWLKKQRLNAIAGTSARAKQDANLKVDVQESEKVVKRAEMMKRAQARLHSGHHVPMSHAERDELKNKKKLNVTVDAVPEEEDRFQSDCNTPLTLHQIKENQKFKPGANGKQRKVSDIGLDEGARKNNRSEVRHPESTKIKKGQSKFGISNTQPSQSQSPTKKSEQQILDSQASEQGQEDQNWMSYFDQKEFEQAVFQSTQKREEFDAQYGTEDDEAEESDSEPSCDNFGEDILVQKFEVAMDAEERQEQNNLAQKREEFRNRSIMKQAKKKQEAKTEKVEQAPKPTPQVNTKLSERFDALKRQINERILQDRVQRQTKLRGRLHQSIEASPQAYYSVPDQRQQLQQMPQASQFQVTRRPQLQPYGEASLALIELDVQDQEIPTRLQRHFRQYMPVTDTRGPSNAYKPRSRVGASGRLVATQARKQNPPALMKQSIESDIPQRNLAIRQRLPLPKEQISSIEQQQRQLPQLGQDATMPVENQMKFMRMGQPSVTRSSSSDGEGVAVKLDDDQLDSPRHGQIRLRLEPGAMNSPQIQRQSLRHAVPSTELIRIPRSDHYGSTPHHQTISYQPGHRDRSIARKREKDLSQEDRRPNGRLPAIQHTPQMYRVASSVVKNATPIHHTSHYNQSQHLSHVLSAERSLDSIVFMDAFVGNQNSNQQARGISPQRRMLTGEHHTAQKEAPPYAVTHSPMTIRKRKDSNLVSQRRFREGMVASSPTRDQQSNLQAQEFESAGRMPTSLPRITHPSDRLPHPQPQPVPITTGHHKYSHSHQMTQQPARPAEIVYNISISSPQNKASNLHTIDRNHIVDYKRERSSLVFGGGIVPPTSQGYQQLSTIKSTKDAKRRAAAGPASKPSAEYKR